MNTSHPRPKTNDARTGVLALIGTKYCADILLLLAKASAPMRFNALRRGLNNVACKTLSSSLKRLEQEQLILRTQYPQIPPKVEYSLTEAGYALIPVLRAFHSWSTQHPLPQHSGQE
ncbi:MAG: helix-turn-helix transcriptional regulator [Oscillibacter sp.]|nr:helix-turn-helix transcriptional regulator [Oscillibacter sp.]